MDTFRIKPSKIQGDIAIPPSKSHTLRALLFALMAKSKSVVRNYLNSPDTHAMIAAIRQLGAEVSVFPDRIEIINSQQLRACTIDAGNSGQVLRFIAALAALGSKETIITIDHFRPIEPLISALKQLGARAKDHPLKVQGPITGGLAVMDGTDSQPVSAMLIACSFLKEPTLLKVENAGEKPWIDLTLFWLKKLGALLENDNYAQYRISGNLTYEGFDVTIPGDWSSASYAIAAALITRSEVTLHGIDIEDVQGDKKLIDALKQMGADIETRDNRVIVRPSKLRGRKIDINDFIDMITILPVIACFAEGHTEITGAAIARKKESDRIAAITAELRKMGALIEEKEDGMIISPSPLKGAIVDSYNDHRMVLSLAVAGFAASGETEIQNVGCVAKTYVNFKRDFQALGALIC